ncbi:MAG: hypothetical protein K2M12_05135 [Muribaculaceae bacterium]|nr:hypothetical protein [Muribaculaceae bacterium]
MNNEQHKFTIAELEALSQAYLDCRLSRLQEKELELVLMNSDASSPVIDEARETMGIATLMESVKSTPALPRRKILRWINWCAAAACLTIVLGSALWFLRPDLGAAPAADDAQFVVYVDGKRLSPEDAEKMALREQAMCMAMMESALRNAREIQLENERLLTLKHDKK